VIVHFLFDRVNWRNGATAQRRNDTTAMLLTEIYKKIGLENVFIN
jgi:hypothetical protein